MKSVPTARPGAAGFNKKSPLRRLLHSWQLYVMLLPALVYLAIFNYAPMYGLQIAFRDYIPTLGISGSPWVGLKHFSYFMNSPQFADLIVNTVSLSLLAMVFSFPVPIILALLLNECRAVWMKKTVQNITYMPYFISTVVLVGMVINFTSPSIGVINTIITRLGGSPVDFMGKAEWFRPLYIISGIWQTAGWNSIIYIAALSGIDTELHEAAQIDGASRVQRLWHINLPWLRPTIIILFIMNWGNVMNVGFEKTYLMQNALNLSVSEVLSTYIYKTGILRAQFSYTTAIGLFNSIINFLLLLVVNRISSKISDVSLF